MTAAATEPAVLPPPPAAAVREFDADLAEAIERTVALEQARQPGDPETAAAVLDARRELAAVARNAERLAAVDAAISDTWSEIAPALEQLEQRFDRLSVLLGARRWLAAPTETRFAAEAITPNRALLRAKATAGWGFSAQECLRALRRPATGGVDLQTVVGRLTPAARRRRVRIDER